MKIQIRRFTREDIPYKVRWINDPENNRFLHYDLPLEYTKTLLWFERIEDRTDRYDAVIEADGVPVGLIGLLSIDRHNRKAEYYIAMGETEYKGRGIAAEASKQLLSYAFFVLRLEKIYLYTETENLPAQKLFLRTGFMLEGRLKNDLFSRGRYVDRYAYGITKDAFLRLRNLTPIQFMGVWNGNNLYMKRDDLIPYSFGGNKARKARLFFDQIDAGGYDCVVTYGSSHSNHCRIVSNMAAERKLPCIVISPSEVSDSTYNSRFMELFGAEMITVPVAAVHDTIESNLRALKDAGRHPYFIPGGGHGNLGTRAYVECYDEICHYERENRLHFDYIFLASGTGTTQAGLICGQLMENDDRKIVGISIARKNPRGRNVVLNSVKGYLQAEGVPISEDRIQKATIFLDEYTGDGYGKDCEAITETIRYVLTQYGIPLDGTYTGKAVYGMREFLARAGICGKNILFIHTGGTPLFFDRLREQDTAAARRTAAK